MDFWILPIVGVLSSSAMVILVVYFIARTRQRRAEIQAEVQTRLIDRFGSAPELIEFLQSPAGRQFVSGVQSAPAIMARERIASGFSRSIIILSVGVAFLALTFFYSRGFAVPAALFFCLGAGSLLATFVSYRLSARLISQDGPHSTREA